MDIEIGVRGGREEGPEELCWVGALTDSGETNSGAPVREEPGVTRVCVAVWPMQACTDLCQFCLL